MQRTQSYWRWLSVACLTSALFASACVITTDDDDTGKAGAGGSGATAGAAAGAAGSSTAAGAGGTAAGAGGTGGVMYVCDDDPKAPGTPNPTCEPATDADSPCNKCITTNCCTEYKECYATGPGNQCGWGGPKDEGEIVCMQLCAQDALIEQGVLGEDEINGCVAKCGTKKSLGSTLDCALPGGTTSAAFSCMREKCMTECIGEE